VNGDAEAFGLLFARHKDRLWAVAVRTLGDLEEAADALQDAMISAFRQAGGFRGDAAVTTWLHRIVVNACLDRLRRRAARPAVTGLDEQVMDVLGPALPGTDVSDSAETALEVRAALRALPPDQQAALVLVDMLGYSVADAAAVLGTSPGTVKSRCARGRARLVPRLGHLRGRPEPSAPVPAGPVPAGPVPAGPVSAGPVPAGPVGPAGPQPAPPTGNQPPTGRVSPAEGGDPAR
jgi:RNA polymerase sigma-70 factor (ECF subfamily)